MTLRHDREMTEDERTLFTYAGPEGANICDTVRIVEAGSYRFALLGKFRNTREDPGVWLDEKGAVKHFDYVKETTVASGQTMPQLVESLRVYLSLVKLNREGNVDDEVSALLKLAGHD